MWNQQCVKGCILQFFEQEHCCSNKFSAHIHLEFRTNYWKKWMITEAISKGQLILKCLFGVFKLTKNINEIFARFFALAIKKKSSKKKKSMVKESKWNHPIGGIKSPYFLFDLFLEATAEILTKIALIFWSIWRHQKDILKLTDS